MSPSPFLNRVGSNFALGREHIRKLIGFPKPVSNRGLDFIAVFDLNDVNTLDFDARSLRRTWGAFSVRPRNTQSSRKFRLGRTKK